MKSWTGIALFTVLAALPVLAGSAPPTPPRDLPPALNAGFKAWAGKCAQCHAPERAYSTKYVEEKQIKALVGRMARKQGASISRADQTAITAYLVWHAKNTGSEKG
jgi:hypothetical protein